MSANGINPELVFRKLPIELKMTNHLLVDLKLGKKFEWNESRWVFFDVIGRAAIFYELVFDVVIYQSKIQSLQFKKERDFLVNKN